MMYSKFFPFFGLALSPNSTYSKFSPKFLTEKNVCSKIKILLPGHWQQNLDFWTSYIFLNKSVLILVLLLWNYISLPHIYMFLFLNKYKIQLYVHHQSIRTLLHTLIWPFWWVCETIFAYVNWQHRGNNLLENGNYLSCRKMNCQAERGKMPAKTKWWMVFSIFLFYLYVFVWMIY